MRCGVCNILSGTSNKSHLTVALWDMTLGDTTNTEQCQFLFLITLANVMNLDNFSKHEHAYELNSSSTLQKVLSSAKGTWVLVGGRDSLFLQRSSNKNCLLITVWTNYTIILKWGSLTITDVGMALLLLYFQSQCNWRVNANKTQHHLEKKLCGTMPWGNSFLIS